MTFDELRASSERLADYVGTGFIDAFSGPGGLYAVYTPPRMGMLDDLTTRAPGIVTMRERVRLVTLELDEPQLDWIDEHTARAAARALASGLITARDDDSYLVVSETDSDRALSAR